MLWQPVLIDYCDSEPLSLRLVWPVTVSLLWSALTMSRASEPAVTVSVHRNCSVTTVCDMPCDCLEILSHSEQGIDVLCDKGPDWWTVWQFSIIDMARDSLRKLPKSFTKFAEGKVFKGIINIKISFCFSSFLSFVIVKQKAEDALKFSVR